MLLRLVVVSAIVLTPQLATAEAAARLVVIHRASAESAEETEALARTMRSYLSDIAIEVTVIESELPAGPFESTRAAAVAVASAQGSSLVLWTEGGAEHQVVLFVAHLSGGATVVRSIDLDDEPPANLRRTIAAVVRAVIDTGVLDVVAEAEQRVEATPPTAARPEIEQGGPRRDEAPPAWRVGVQAAWGVRWLSEPGPAHQDVSLAVTVSLVRWLGLRLSGRLAPPVEPATPQGGSVSRGALSVSVGLDRASGILRFGLLAGVDLEWLRGGVELGDDRGRGELDHFGVGLLLRPFFRVRLWRGLLLHTALEAVIRPQRELYLLRGVPTASSGFLELGVELGLGWEFL